METFYKWFNDQFFDWSKKNGQRKTIREFADFLGVERTHVSYWMNGKRPPSMENVRILAKKLGDGVYTSLNMPLPDQSLSYVEKSWDDLRPDQQLAIRDAVSRYLNDGKDGRHEDESSPANA